MIDDIHKELQSISIQWILDDPFWGHLLSGIPKSTAQGLAPLSWSIESGSPPILQLSVAPASWAKLPSLEIKKACLLHELLHLIFHHPFTTDYFHFPHLYDLACDWIIDELQIIPNQRSVGISPAALGVEITGTRVESYYQILEQFWLTEIRSPNPSPALQQLKEYPSNAARSSHQSWHTSIAKLSQGEKEIIKAGIDQLLNTTLQRVGPAVISHWPAALRLALENRKPVVQSTINWRRVLRLFVGRNKKTQLKNTLRRPSKRYGTTPGLRIHQQQKLLVVLDTSASIQALQFDSFFAEIHQLWKLGVEVHIIECDTKIRRDYPYLGQRPSFVEGRGGSSFDPPIDWANQVYHPDAILYFTDGDGPRLQVKSRYPLLWIRSQSQRGQWVQEQGISIEIPVPVVKKNKPDQL